MEDAKHSPAPWKNGRDANGDVVICQADYITGRGRNPEYQANRALFDAAPELLDALIYLVNAHEHPSAISRSRPGVLDLVPSALDKARTAINRAMGEAA